MLLRYLNDGVTAQTEIIINTGVSLSLLPISANFSQPTQQEVKTQIDQST